MNILANAVIDTSALIIIILLYISSKRVSKKDFRMRIFRYQLIGSSVFMISDILAWYLDGCIFTGSRPTAMILNALIYFSQIFNSFLFLLFTDFWVYHSMERLKKRIPVYIIPLIVDTLLLISNFSHKQIFSINDINMYERGELYVPSMLFFYSYGIFSLFIALNEMFRTTEKEQRISCIWITSFLVFPFAVAVTGLFVYGISLTAPSYAISLLMIYLNVHQRRLLEEKIKVAQRDAQLQQANVSVMLSQIQPHFLYNSLNVIKELCRTDPELAEKVTVDFSRYLRSNLDSISSQKPIPFYKELEHTKNFLSIEKMQYEDNIDVIYDIKIDSFLLPTLTLQPLAENAVKYGLKKKEHITVKISTYDDENNYYVSVEDDGTGFDPDAPLSKSRSHVGLTNVSERLALQSNSTMTIESSQGNGTKVIISIPKERKCS
ncbi:MAG: histidine kinase [Oscillospiraceae bacterium]|nr:histidine kinase [Oscillospiraceae bacterium]